MRAKYGIFDDRGEQLFNFFLHLKVNKIYKILNFMHLFCVIQESNLLQQIGVTNQRGFAMHVLDNNRQVSQN